MTFSIRLFSLFFFLVQLSNALPHLPRHLEERQLAPARGFELPVYRRRRTHLSSNVYKRDGTSGSVGLGDNTDMVYTVPIQVGQTETVVDLDTGSSDLWVVTDACQTSLCKNSSATPYPSSSLTASGPSVTLLYGDSQTGTNASGQIGSDTVSIAGLTMADQQFAAINDTTNPTILYGPAGIFGLGFPSESVITSNLVDYQFDTPATTDSFISTISSNGPLLSRMAMSGALGQPMFVITLQRDTVDISGVGTLTVGKLPDGVDNSTLTWVPVRLYTVQDGGIAPPTFAPDEVYPYRWEIDIDAVYLDGTKLPDSAIPAQGVTSNTVSALIDTGNSLIRGPSDVVQDIMSMVSPGFSGGVSQAPTVPCSVPHSLAFQIGGKMFPVDPRDFIGLNSDDTTNCTANRVVSTDPPSEGALYSWNLGDPFLKSNLVAFYYGNLTHPSVDPPRIGFLSTVPSNATELLTDAAQEAKQSGQFEASIEAAPTESAQVQVSTLSAASNLPAVSPSPSIAVASSSSQGAQKSAAFSSYHGSLNGLWIVSASFLFIHGCGIW